MYKKLLVVVFFISSLQATGPSPSSIIPRDVVKRSLVLSVLLMSLHCCAAQSDAPAITTEDSSIAIKAIGLLLILYGIPLVNNVRGR